MEIQSLNQLSIKVSKNINKIVSNIKLLRRVKLEPTIVSHLGNRKRTGEYKIYWRFQWKCKNGTVLGDDTIHTEVWTFADSSTCTTYFPREPLNAVMLPVEVSAADTIVSYFACKIVSHEGIIHQEVSFRLNLSSMIVRCPNLDKNMAKWGETWIGREGVQQKPMTRVWHCS